jgi:hypothetical protein
VALKRPVSFDGAVLAVYQTTRAKFYVVLGSTAPIYQALEDGDGDGDGKVDGAGDGGAAGQPDVPFDTRDVAFYECTQRRCICSPAAFDFQCLEPADYLRLRESHRLQDVTEYATVCDYEFVACCIAVARSYWQRKCRHAHPPGRLLISRQ